MKPQQASVAFVGRAELHEFIVAVCAPLTTTTTTTSTSTTTTTPGGSPNTTTTTSTTNTHTTTLPPPCDDDSKLSHVRFNIQIMETWDNISHQTETSLRFASSQPAACRVGLEDGPRPVDLPKHASLNETLSTETIPNCVIDLEADNRARAMATVQAAIKARGIPELPRSYELPRGCRLPIRAQGLCSSSWAMAAIGAFEKQVCVHTGHR